jgi:hypothetical protein
MALGGRLGQEFGVPKAKMAIVVFGVLALWTTRPAGALTFPGTCITPPATVTRITGIDTRHAEMEARYTPQASKRAQR